VSMVDKKKCIWVGQAAALL